MGTVCKKDMCAGCMACVDICPKDAIEIVDSLKAYNAVIDEQLCVNCNACHTVCQYNSDMERKKPINWYQGWADMQEIREGSSSGGLATALSYSFVEKYGSVCSCVFREGKFGFEFTDTVDDLAKFAGSKYVKSNPLGIYKQIKSRLEKEEKVLFIGLPCQVAAVKQFVGPKNTHNLFTVDLICHGSPTPKLLENFLNCYHYSLQTIEGINFRKKSTYCVYDKNNGIVPEGVQDTYTDAFLHCLSYTENCYSCKYATLERVADITLGDSWGSELDAEEQRRGISLILCQTEKGKQLVQSAKLHLEMVNLDKAVEANRQLRHPSEIPEKREKFFEHINKGCSFNKAMKRCFPKRYYKRKLKGFLLKLK